MLLTVQLVGSGVDGDPFRAPLPTYTIQDVDYDAMTCTVEIPDVDAPPSIVTAIAPEIVAAAAIVASAKLSPADHAAWHQLLDDRYQEHAGKFRPQLA